MQYHQPVLAAEAIELLNIQPDGIYVDATFGGGGHSNLILQNLSDKGRLLGFDQDDDAQRNIPNDPRFIFAPNNFRYLKRYLKLHRLPKVDGILADLGVSSHQLDEETRGFSYRFNVDLDMRMDRGEKKTAADVLNNYSAEELQEVFSKFGEVRNAKTLANLIVQERNRQAINSVGSFVTLLEQVMRGNRQRYLAQVFQAIRIEVNDEMGALEDFLKQSLEVLEQNGRLVIISYHSIEDRMVKHFLRTGNTEGKQDKDFYGNIFRPFKVLTKKAMLPTDSEIRENQRARSAKMRAGAFIKPHSEQNLDG